MGSISGVFFARANHSHDTDAAKGGIFLDVSTQQLGTDLLLRPRLHFLSFPAPLISYFLSLSLPPPLDGVGGEIVNNLVVWIFVSFLQDVGVRQDQEVVTLASSICLGLVYHLRAGDTHLLRSRTISAGPRWGWS